MPLLNCEGIFNLLIMTKRRIARENLALAISSAKDYSKETGKEWSMWNLDVTVLDYLMPNEIIKLVLNSGAKECKLSEGYKLSIKN